MKMKIYAIASVTLAVALIVVGLQEQITAQDGQPSQVSIGQQIIDLKNQIGSLSEQELEMKIDQIIKSLPNDIVGFQIIKETVINQQQADQLKAILDRLTPEYVMIIKGYIQQSILMTASIAYELIKSKITLPQSVQNLQTNVTEFIGVLLASQDAIDKDGVTALQALANKAVEIFEKLYNQRNSLAGYNLTNDINALKDIFKANFEKLSAFVRKNSGTLNQLYDKALQISPNDALQVFNNVKTTLGV